MSCSSYAKLCSSVQGFHATTVFQINQETVNKVDFRPSEPLELYFLAQYLQERIQSKRNVSVYGLYQALPESLRRQLEMPLTSKESLFRIRDLLWRASFDQLARYGSRNGNYYLAKDLKQTFGRSLYLGQIYEGVHINLGSLYTLIGDGLEVASFLGMVDKRFETEWNVRRVHLSLKQKDWKDRG